MSFRRCGDAERHETYVHTARLDGPWVVVKQYGTTSIRSDDLVRCLGVGLDTTMSLLFLDMKHSGCSFEVTS